MAQIQLQRFHAGPFVEVGCGPGVVGVRDSKARARGHLVVSGAAWATFTRGAASGRFIG